MKISANGDSFKQEMANLDKSAGQTGKAVARYVKLLSIQNMFDFNSRDGIQRYRLVSTIKEEDGKVNDNFWIVFPKDCFKHEARAKVLCDYLGYHSDGNMSAVDMLKWAMANNWPVGDEVDSGKVDGDGNPIMEKVDTQIKVRYTTDPQGNTRPWPQLEFPVVSIEQDSGFTV